MKKEMVHTPKPLLINRHLPTQADIKQRMMANYGTASKLVESVIDPCAEEAERILYDLLTSSLVKTTIFIKAVRYRNSPLNRKKKTGYRCPKCDFPEVKLNDNYCAGCGKPIEWS